MLSASDLRNEDYGPDPGRLFCDTPDFDYKRTIKQLKKLDQLHLESHAIDAPVGQSAIWQIRFEFRGYHFFIDTNHHGATSLFFVSEPECPDEILLELLNAFAIIGRLTWDDS